jgi:hypothetical protein
MHIFANKSESLLIASQLYFLLGLQRMSVFALACVTESLPWKIGPESSSLKKRRRSKLRGSDCSSKEKTWWYCTANYPKVFPFPEQLADLEVAKLLLGVRSEALRVFGRNRLRNSFRKRIRDRQKKSFYSGNRFRNRLRTSFKSESDSDSDSENSVGDQIQNDQNLKRREFECVKADNCACG